MELIIDDRQDKLNVSEELIEKIKDIILECLDYEDYDEYEDDLDEEDDYACLRACVGNSSLCTG